jgi:formylglycine-generating enzyme required for sulfatase activity
VWQWCEDWKSAERKYRVLRGASWYDNDEFILRSSYRNFDVPTVRHDYGGFRCVLGFSGG